MKSFSIGRPGTMFVLGAVVLGGLTAYALYNYLEGVSKVPAAPQTADVVVARGDVPARQEITPNLVTLIKVPVGMVINNTATKLEQVVGKVSITRLKALEQIRLQDIAEKGKAPGLAFSIPTGMRAITIGISDTKGVSGAIYPGDRVDILCSLRDPTRGEQVVQVPLQNLLVLAIDKAKTEATELGAVSTLTLCAKPEEAQMLTVAEESGTTRVILRAKDDQVILDDKAMSLDQFLKRAPKPAEEQKPREEKPAEKPPPPPPPPVRKITVYDGSAIKEFNVPY